MAEIIEQKRSFRWRWSSQEHSQGRKTNADNCNCTYWNYNGLQLELKYARIKDVEQFQSVNSHKTVFIRAKFQKGLFCNVLGLSCVFGFAYSYDSCDWWSKPKIAKRRTNGLLWPIEIMNNWAVISNSLDVPMNCLNQMKKRFGLLASL